MFGGNNNQNTMTSKSESITKSRPVPTAKIGTLIGSGTTLEGSVKFSGGLHVDGCVKGNVQAADNGDANLTLSAKGRIIGEVRVPQIKIDGTVEGDVHCTGLVELSENAKIVGNVYYSLIKMGMGAQVNGQLVHAKNEGEVVKLKNQQQANKK